MSKRNKHRRLKVQGDSFSQPVRIRSRGELIMEYVLYGNQRGKDAAQELFHVTRCECPLCRV